MRYGYFVPALSASFGDAEVAMHCRTIWQALPTPEPQRFEGVSAWVVNGVLTIRRVVRNFWTGKYDAHEIQTGPTAAWLGIGPPALLTTGDDD